MNIPHKTKVIKSYHKTRLMRNAFTVFVIQLLFCTLSPAQDITIGGIFPTIDHSGKLSKRWSYNSYLFGALKPYQSSEGNARPLYFYGEFGISYLLANNLWLTASYVYEKQEPSKDIARNEHRLFQQLTYVLPLNRFNIKQRLRFDERFIEDTGRDQYEFSHRIRYLLGATYDLSEAFYLMSYTEFFFNTTSGASFQFNENWSAFQLGYKFNQKSSIEFGYLYVGWIYNNQNDWFNQNYLQMTWVSKLNFTRPRNE